MSNPLHQVPISLKTQARNVERFKLISANSPLSTTYASQEGPKSSQTVELQIVSCFGIEASVLGVGHTELYPHCFFFFSESVVLLGLRFVWKLGAPGLGFTSSWLLIVTKWPEQVIFFDWGHLNPSMLGGTDSSETHWSHWKHTEW